MLFNSLEFLIFFVVVYFLYLILPHRGQNRLLLIASLFFYGFWDWRFLSLIFFSTVVDYFCALKISASSQHTRKTFLAISVISNLSLLGFFKYFNFFADSFVALLNHFGITAHPILIKVILPVGISFYTFQALSYTIDVYRKDIPATKNFLNFFLYITFFPQLVAGPIERASHLLPQVERPRTVTLNKFYEGCFLIYWGLFEKLFIAGNLARIVDPIFAQPGPYEGEKVLVGLYAFAFQIFCDFDAYSNMARGLALCMGFELMINFRLPYFSANPREFWQKWHISLSTWLRDYLYIPLGGNKISDFVTCRNLFIVMLLGGLWHGASWTFVLWGIYHGLLLLVHRLAGQRLPKTPRVLRVFLFFHLIILGWLFFRAGSLAQLSAMFNALFSNFHFDHLSDAGLLHFAGIVLPLFLVQLWQAKSQDLSVIFRQHWLAKTVIYAFLAYLILGWGILKPEEFIYFQF